jgi:hypothetical protein
VRDPLSRPALSCAQRLSAAEEIDGANEVLRLMRCGLAWRAASLVLSLADRGLSAQVSRAMNASLTGDQLDQLCDAEERQIAADGGFPF